MQWAIRQLGEVRHSQLKRRIRNPKNWMIRAQAFIASLGMIEKVDTEISSSASPKVWLDHLPARWSTKAIAIQSQFPRLAELISRLAQIEMTSTCGESIETLAWVERNAEKLQSFKSMDDPTHFQLCFCLCHRELDSRWQSFLLSVLTSEQLSAADFRSRFSCLVQAKKKFKKTVKMKGDEDRVPEYSPPFYKTMLRHLEWLAAASPKTRSRVSGMLAAITDDQIVQRLESAHQEVEEHLHAVSREISRAETLGSRGYIQSFDREAYHRVFSPESSFRILCQATSVLTRLCKRLEEISNVMSWSRDVGRFFQAVEVIPWTIRMQLIACWESIHSRHSHCDIIDRSYLDSLRRFSRFFRQHGVCSQIQQHWNTSELHVIRSEIVFDASELKLSEEQYRRLFQLLHLLYHESSGCFIRELSQKQTLVLDSFVEVLPTIIAQTDSIEEALEIVKRFVTSENLDVPSRWKLESALSISRDADHVAILVQALDECEIDSHGVDSLLQVNNAELLDCLVESLKHGESRQVLSMIDTIDLLEAANCRFPNFGFPTTKLNGAWLAQYPEPLWDSIKQLATVTDDAVRMTERLLHREFRDHSDVRNEIAFLDSRLQSSDLEPNLRQKLEIRRGNLQLRLDHRVEFNSGKLANLKRRILKRSRYECLRFAQQRCEELIQGTLHGLCPNRSLPSRLRANPYTRLLPGILKLPTEQRVSGLRLLLGSDAQRKNAQPLHEKNQRFLDRIRQMGVNTQAWLDASLPTNISMANGELFSLAFESDPLEVMLMGFYFSTCLAPNDFNFFSAVSNATDVNKQVLYTRDRKGAVVGRCLFTLNDRGQIMTFRRYWHRADPSLNLLVDDFALRLAANMNTSLTADGNVSNLIFDDWYDDGPVDGGLSSIGFSTEDSPLLQILRNANPRDVVSQLTEFFRSEKNLAANIGWVFQQEALTTRADLLSPLIECIKDYRQLDFETRLHIATLANRFGQVELARQVMGVTRVSKILKRITRRCGREWMTTYHETDQVETLNLLYELDPRIARRYVRMTRQNNVTQDIEERDPARRQVLAKLHRTYGNQALADKLSG